MYQFLQSPKFLKNSSNNSNKKVRITLPESPIAHKQTEIKQSHIQPQHRRIAKSQRKSTTPSSNFFTPLPIKQINKIKSIQQCFQPQPPKKYQIDPKYHDQSLSIKSIPTFLKNKSQRSQKQLQKHHYSGKIPQHTVIKSPSSKSITQPSHQQFIDFEYITAFRKLNKRSKQTQTNQKTNIIKQEHQLKQPRDTTHSQSFNYQDKYKTNTNPKYLTKRSLRNFTIADFQKIKQLGIGHYGEVNLVREVHSGFICAIKQIPKQKFRQEKISQQLIRQIKIQFYLDHPNIVKMFGWFSDQKNVYLILQGLLGGTLDQFLLKKKSLTQVKAISIMKQLCDSVKHLHCQPIIHRDIKPQNIVIHQSVVKLCDFGWSVYLQDNKLRSTFCGTPLYVSPQVLKGHSYDTKVDIWALGVLMYEIIIGHCPFKITKQEQLAKIINEQPFIPQKVNISSHAADFILDCLNKKAELRPNIEQLLDHPIFLEYKWRMNSQKHIFQLI